MPILIIEYKLIVSQKYFFCISIVCCCVNSRRPFSTMPADQQSSYKIVIDSTVNITEAYRRGGGVVILEAFSSLAALKVFTMKVSSAGGASWRWDDGVCISTNNL